MNRELADIKQRLWKYRLIIEFAENQIENMKSNQSAFFFYTSLKINMHRDTKLDGTSEASVDENRSL